MFKNIKNIIKRIILERYSKNSNRKVQYHNFDSAKSVNLIFNADNSDEFKIVKNFIKELSDSGKTVNAVGFVKNKDDITKHLFKKGVNFFSLKELNLYGKPKNTDVTDFINDSPDILLNLSMINTFPIQYIMVLSKAVFKVSDFKDFHYSDLTFDITKNNTLEYLLEQTKFYLKSITVKID